MKPASLVVASALVLTASLAAAQQGVTKTEITIGTIQDMSGPLASFGKQARFGMQLRIDELNEQGGVHGRKIKLLLEDSGYDPKKAVLGAQKLVNQDKIFIMAGHVGTAHNNAAFPVQVDKNIINFLPISSARDMYEPFHKLKYSFGVPYSDQMRMAVPKLAKEKNAKRVCTVYQDDDYGLEVQQGTEAGLKTIGMEVVEKTSFKRGATDFSSQVAKLKASNCDFVVLGTIIRETIGVVGESRKTGFNPIFLTPNAAYTDLIPKLGGKIVDNVYATMTVQHPYLDEASQPLRFWANKYKTKFNEDPGTLSIYGYQIIDIFIRAAQKVGPNLTTDSFIKAMDTMNVPPDIFGADAMVFTATKRLSGNASRISQIQDGRWRVISEYTKPNPG